ncbi:hypothetical protein V1477_006220 [Vespula maculifrons]|uniref:Uncharacterized protein n=1 Tax=Vespula maculifrons TaxID=7453 RepID=A0ABD2CJT4_VESMC
MHFSTHNNSRSKLIMSAMHITHLQSLTGKINSYLKSRFYTGYRAPRPTSFTFWLFPSTEPLVPNSANKKSNITSVKLAKDVFFVPIRTTCGGRITNFCFLPATISGFFSRMMLNTLTSNSSINIAQYFNFMELKKVDCIL